MVVRASPGAKSNRGGGRKVSDSSRERPLARSTDLIIEELGDEVLVYDTKTDRGHSLSPEAAKVWRACNGTTSAEVLSARLGLELETVSRALDELSSCELLETSPTIVADGSTRREVTLRLAKVGAAAAAAPLILSVAAPTAMAAVTLEQCLAVTQRSGNCGGMGSTGCSFLGCCCCPDCIQPCQQGQNKCCVDVPSNCNSDATFAALGFRCETTPTCV
jgi:DNA-binding MarR family transcriptional regulator